MPADTALALPEDLVEGWDTKALEAYHGLEPRQQKFILKYLECLNGAEAYRHAYNELASDHVATNSGSRLLAKAGMKTLIAPLLECREEDFVTVRHTFLTAARDAVKPIYGKDSEGQPEKIEDLPDHDVRIKAAQALAKLQGLNAPDKQEVKVAAVHLHFDSRDEAL